MKAYVYMQDRFVVPLGEHLWKPLCDVYRTDDELVIRIEAAGMSSENLSISTQSDHIVISGIRHDAERKDQYMQMEIPFGSFQIVVEGSGEMTIDDDSIEAIYENGFLYVRCKNCSVSGLHRNPASHRSELSETGGSR